MDTACSQANWASSYKWPCFVATDIHVIFTVLFCFAAWQCSSVANNNTKKTVHCRAAASRISYLVQQSIQKWFVPQEKVTQMGVCASFDLLRLYLSGVPVISE